MPGHLALDDLLVGARLLARLPGHLRRSLSVDDARVTLARRLATREASFLALVRSGVYRQPASPYRRLLELAGCEYGDLEALVGREGVEGALSVLLRQGVYLSVDEFKGRRPVVRGHATIEVRPNLLIGPGSAHWMPTRTGGSSGPPSAATISLDFIRDRAVDTMLALDARGGLNWRHALWGIPGGAAMIRLLEFSAFGARPERWFSQVAPGAPGLHPRYAWSARAIWLASVLALRPLPRPEHVPFDDPWPIVRWIAESLHAGRAPHLHAFASAVVEVCRAATVAGVDLRGANFTMASEPITAGRMSAARATGAEVQPCYAIIECGPVGYGCLAPDAPDDMHFLADRHALVQADDGTRPAGLPRQALWLSSIRPTAPFVMLNVSVGDQAVVTVRTCGCPLEAQGWPTHLHTVRSFEKLTAGGMTFPDADIIRVLEELLPGRFGGLPIDYQLVEEESAGGRPRLRLLVHPRVGFVDTDTIARVFLAEIGRGSGVERLMAQTWEQAHVLAVVREAPRTTEMGKILHLHVERGPRAERRAAS